jgi:hypothetical protein
LYCVRIHCFIPDSVDVDTWIIHRRDLKGTHAVLRQFANLPMGARLISQLDVHIAEQTKLQSLSTALESISDKLTRTAPRLEMDEDTKKAKKSVETYVAFYKRLRGEFSLIGKHAAGKVFEQRGSNFDGITARFEDAAKRLASFYSFRCHLGLEGLMDALKDIGTGDETIETTKFCKMAEECAKEMPDAKAAEIECIGSSDLVRSWAAKRLEYQRFLDAVQAAIRMLGTKGVPDCSQMIQIGSQLVQREAITDVCCLAEALPSRLPPDSLNFAFKSFKLKAWRCRIA